VAKVKKKVASERLADVPREKWFLCSDGRILRNLSELKIALEEMSEETFRYHFNKSQNDFADWVRDVVGDDKLSRDLLESNTRTESAKRVADRITRLRSKLVVEWSPLFKPRGWPV